MEVWQQARRFAAAVSAVTRSGPLARDIQLREQIDGCVDALLSDLSEGFEQGSDGGFAQYLYVARGSCAETRDHLGVAQLRGHLSPETAGEVREAGAHTVRLITGLIGHLLSSDRQHRG